MRIERGRITMSNILRATLLQTCVGVPTTLAMFTYFTYVRPYAHHVRGMRGCERELSALHDTQRAQPGASSGQLGPRSGDEESTRAMRIAFVSHALQTRILLERRIKIPLQAHVCSAGCYIDSFYYQRIVIPWCDAAAGATPDEVMSSFAAAVAVHDQMAAEA
jgi:hypothetical protein